MRTNWRAHKKNPANKDKRDKSHRSHSVGAVNSTSVPFVPFVLPETIQIAYGPVAYKDIESVFSIDPLWTRFKGDPRWLNHLAETLLRWRKDGTC